MAATPEDFTIEDGRLLHVSNEYIEQHSGCFTIPDKALYVDRNAFLNCPSLEHLKIPGSTRTLPPDAIRNCPSLKQLTFDVRERKKILRFYDQKTDEYCHDPFPSGNLKITIIDQHFLRDHTKNIWTAPKAGGFLPIHYYPKNTQFEFIPIETDVSIDRNKPPSYKFIEEDLDIYIKKREGKKDSNGKTKEYLSPSFFGDSGKSFTQKKEAVEALKKALKGEYVDLTSHLETLRDGELGSILRRRAQLSSSNILVGRRVTTVTEFITALQDKVDAFHSINGIQPGVKKAKSPQQSSDSSPDFKSRYRQETNLDGNDGSNHELVGPTLKN